MTDKHLPSAALFDLDGVLIDTEPVYTAIWRDIECSYPTGIENFAMKIKGTTLEQILDRYYPDEIVQHEVCRMLVERENDMTYPVFEGVMEFLEDLAGCGIPSVIVTSSNDAKMQRLAGREPRFHSYFAAVITDSCVTHSKPHPEPYLVGASSVGASPKDCLVFEDSFAGMEAGRAAGATVIGLATTNPRESIVGKADAIIDGFGGLTVSSLLDMLSEGGRRF